jgi:hypothetical protein
MTPKDVDNLTALIHQFIHSLYFMVLGGHTGHNSVHYLINLHIDVVLSQGQWCVLQFRATARISLRPLVEQLPCLGAAEVSLMEPPYVNLSLMLINRLDLMQLPVVKEAVKFIIYKVCLACKSSECRFD